MTSLNEALNRVLRAELTAVHQQFVHVLVLRDWGLEDTARRIMEVDRVDFPVAMKIIDRMVASGQPVVLEANPFTPGACEAGILAAELAMERRLLAALTAAKVPTGPELALIEAALAPRQEYMRWLSDRRRSLEEREPAVTPLADELAQSFSHIIVMIEQAMVHAFVHWHHGDKANADAAWATSGAAMMHGTAIVRWLAARGAAPVPGAFPSLRISQEPETAVEFDRALAGSFGRCIGAPSNSDHADVREICAPIADYAKRLSDWRPGQEHPAKDTNPPAFRSFEATLAKFVWT